MSAPRGGSATDDLKESSSPGSGRVKEGGRERRRDRSDGLQQPNGLNCLQRSWNGRRQVTTGAKVTHGRSLSATGKPALELSVRNLASSLSTSTQREPGCSNLPAGWVRHGFAVRLIPFSTSGHRCQGHSRPSKASRVALLNAGPSIRAPGYRSPASHPSLVTSRTRRGVSIVVRARESRVHGEGRQ